MKRGRIAIIISGMILFFASLTLASAFLEFDPYKAFNKENPFSQEPKIFLSPSTNQYFKIRIVDKDDNPVKNALVSYRVYKKYNCRERGYCWNKIKNLKIADKYTDSNGEVEFNKKVRANKKEKIFRHKFTVYYGKNKKYFSKKSVEDSKTYEIKLSNLKISSFNNDSFVEEGENNKSSKERIKSMISDKEQNHTLTIKIVDKDGSPIEGAIVKIKDYIKRYGAYRRFIKQSYQGITDQTGTITISDYKKDRYLKKIQIYYGGLSENKVFDRKESGKLFQPGNMININLRKIRKTKSEKNNYQNYKTNISFKIRVIDGNNKPVENAEVSLRTGIFVSEWWKKLNIEEWEKTDSEGIAVFNLYKRSWKYKIHVTLVGKDNEYEGHKTTYKGILKRLSKKDRPLTIKLKNLRYSDYQPIVQPTSGNQKQISPSATPGGSAACEEKVRKTLNKKDFPYNGSFTVRLVDKFGNQLRAQTIDYAVRLNQEDTENYYLVESSVTDENGEIQFDKVDERVIIEHRIEFHTLNLEKIIVKIPSISNNEKIIITAVSSPSMRFEQERAEVSDSRITACIKNFFKRYEKQPVLVTITGLEDEKSPEKRPVWLYKLKQVNLGVTPLNEKDRKVPIYISHTKQFINPKTDSKGQVYVHYDWDNDEEYVLTTEIRDSLKDDVFYTSESFSGREKEVVINTKSAEQYDNAKEPDSTLIVSFKKPADNPDAFEIGNMVYLETLLPVGKSLKYSLPESKTIRISLKSGYYALGVSSSPGKGVLKNIIKLEKGRELKIECVSQDSEDYKHGKIIFKEDSKNQNYGQIVCNRIV